MDGVYVVLVDGEIEGVFTTPKKAAEYIRDLEPDIDAHVVIEHQQLDPVILTDDDE